MAPRNLELARIHNRNYYRSTQGAAYRNTLEWTDAEIDAVFAPDRPDDATLSVQLHRTIAGIHCVRSRYGGAIPRLPVPPSRWVPPHTTDEARKRDAEALVAIQRISAVVALDPRCFGYRAKVDEMFGLWDEEQKRLVRAALVLGVEELRVKLGMS